MARSGWFKKLQSVLGIAPSFSDVRSKRAGRAYRRIVVLSDIHYPSKTCISGAPYMNKMATKENALHDISRWRDVDLSVFTGDMVQRDGSQAEYATVKAFVRGLRCRKAFIAGNHELLYSKDGAGHFTTAGLFDRILHMKRYTRTFGPLYYMCRLYGYVLIFLSPDVTTGQAAVELSQQQLHWLQQVLTENRDAPTIIFCHAPLAGTALPDAAGASRPGERDVAQPAQALADILRHQPQVRLWVSGHTHTRPGDPDFMNPVNYFDGRILNVYNGDWDDNEAIYTNSLYLFADRIVIRTYSHKDHCWLPQFDRVVTAVLRKRLAA